MTAVFENQLESLKKLILTEGALVEEAIYQSIKGLLERDSSLAESVIQGDAEIDEMEVRVEEECVKLLALHQPVASDLRFIVAVLKINGDLERMGDLAANIAKRAAYLAAYAPAELSIDFSEMGARAQSMVKMSLDALVNRDAELARRVCADDDALDEMRRDAFDSMPAALEKNPEKSECIIQTLNVVRHLERIGDMATNIAEDVIYMVEGEIVRHRRKMI